MKDNKLVILIDGHSLAYRSYFALERTGMRNSNNEPTWAVFGFFKAFFDLISKIKPDAIAVSFDVSKHTFRNEKYAEYKANRPPMPDAMRQQVTTIRKGIESLNIPIYEQEGYEADDVIGTLCSKITSEGNRVTILTGDQDSFQLLDDDKVSVLLPTKGELIEYDREKVFEKLGVYPEQIADYKALCGDSSDNIPGIKGIGKKGAATLLNEFGTLENIFENADKITKKRLKNLISEGKDSAYLSKDLAIIRRNVEFDFDFQCCSLEIPDLESFVEFLKEMEFRAFLKQLPKLFKDFQNFKEFDFNGEAGKKTEAPKAVLEKPDSQAITETTSSVAVAVKETIAVDQETGQAKLAFAAPVEHENPIKKALIINETGQLQDLIKSLEKAKLFSIDLETDSLKVLQANIVGIAISWQPEPALVVENNSLKALKDNFTCYSAYIPVGHLEGKQIELNEALQLLKPLLEGKTTFKVLHNAKYDAHVLLNYDVKINNIILDTMLASYIDDPSEKHGLKSLSFTRFKIQMTDYEDVAGTGKKQITLDKVDIATVAEYAQMDAAITLKLAHYYAGMLDEVQNKLLKEMEIPLIEVLIDMERNGISLDTDFLSKLSNQLSESIDKLAEQIYAEAKYPEKFNINSPKQLGEILFDHMGLQVTGRTKYKTKTGYSTSAKILENLARRYKIAKLILEYRHLSKLKSTYVDALPKILNPKTNRVHTTFNQSITTTGRLSSSDPNLQNIPIRTELGNSIRKAFVPADKENYSLLAADYSQIELRFLADISQEPNLVEAFKNNKDVHTNTACKVFNVSPEKVTKDMRRQAKVVNFGIIYGKTPFGLSEELNITPTEAKAFIESYFKTYPKVKEYMESTIKKAHQQGFVATKFGRKRYFLNDLSSRNRMIKEAAERAAINSPLQGSAADLIKLAMIDLFKKLEVSDLKSKILLQVHDELVLEVPDNELEQVKELVKDSMENVYNLSVPLIVDICVGKNWMEAK